MPRQASPLGLILQLCLLGLSGAMLAAHAQDKPLAPQTPPVLTQAQDTPPGPARQAQLRRILSQDCGSCHGLTLKGGLGPDLRVDAMRALPHTAIASTIYDGRPGTPMPPWKSMITRAEAEWLASYLQQEPPAPSPKDVTP
ncbi:c-type cytochrome [Roseateles koreensis]|uniref:Cytochrome c n=1 Tax=Roseateles koreensis TaxID=2987526 RepID=A0ABT5KUC8_9BURK|nr:cytochrome c [Roseateles koreensis]MDC8786432.1 cytochrome c [Roseateles koreensis]